MLQAAVELADRDGLEGLSMRKLGQELGVEAMALYRHVRDKDDLLDGIIEVVVGQIERPKPGRDWKTSIRRQVMEARRVMLRHPWARRVLEERGTTGPAVLAYIESILAILHDGGFSLDLAHHTHARARQPVLRLHPGRVRGLERRSVDGVGRDRHGRHGGALPAHHRAGDVGQPRGRPRRAATTTWSSRSAST